MVTPEAGDFEQNPAILSRVLRSEYSERSFGVSRLL